MEKLNLNINYYIMKKLVNFLNEAKSPAPSALKKFKQGKDNVECEFIAGDIYDLSPENRYKDTVSYYKGDGDGYIMSKDGRVFDVKCSEGTSDAGRIVGGTFKISVVIFRVGPNAENIYLTGYSAVFSSPSSPTYGSLISDIKDGIYLEDYLAYHEDDIEYSLTRTTWVKELIDAGDGTGSRTEKMKKRDAKIAKEESFNQRYCVINKNISFSCTGGHSLEFYDNGGYNKIVAEIRPSSTKNKGKGGMFGSGKAEQSVQVPEAVNNAIIEGFRPMAEAIVSNMFGSADAKGLKFEFSISFEGQQKYDGPVFGWDIKNKKFVVLDMEKRKVLDRKYELRLSCVYHRKYRGDTVEFSKFALKFLEDASKIMVKSLGSESAYVAANYKSVMWGKSYYGSKMKAGEAKEECKKQFAKMKGDKTFSIDRYEFYITPEIAAQVLGSKSYEKFFKAAKSEAPSETDVAQIETPEITNGPDKPRVSVKSASETYGKAYGPAKEKMEKWHAGTRRQNLKNCNDGKLRMNYAICKELGFKTEMDLIKKEAESRGIILESMLSMKDYILARL